MATKTGLMRGNPLSPKSAGKSFGFRIQKDMRLRLYQLAALDGYDVSAVVISCIRERIEREMPRIEAAEKDGQFDAEGIRQLLAD